MDAALFRTFRVTERFHAQFRAQCFNVANTPHFANPASGASSLVLNPNGTVNNLGGFTVITSTTGNGREGIDQRVSFSSALAGELLVACDAAAPCLAAPRKSRHGVLFSLPPAGLPADHPNGTVRKLQRRRRKLAH